MYFIREYLENVEAYFYKVVIEPIIFVKKTIRRKNSYVSFKIGENLDLVYPKACGDQLIQTTKYFYVGISILYKNKQAMYLIFIKSLQVLNLDSMQLRSGSIHQIATNLPNLTELNLRNIWLSKRAVLSLANHLTAVNIEKLNLEMLKNVDDEIVRKLVSKCDKLNELNLKETSITSFSIKIIIQYLKTTVYNSMGYCLLIFRFVTNAR